MIDHFKKALKLDFKYAEVHPPEILTWDVVSDPGYRGEACQPLDLDLVDLEVKGYFRIRKVQPEVWYNRK
jgi:hypothetical protein